MKKRICILTFIVVFIDQLSKILVLTNLEISNSLKLIPNFFYITFVKNEGAAFSILQGGRIFFIIISVIAIFTIVKYILKYNKIKKIEIVSYSLLLGGITGNLIDRIVYGYVVDFFDFYFFGFDFAIFNVADMAIVIGAFILFYNIGLKGEKNEVNNSRK